MAKMMRRCCLVAGALIGSGFISPIYATQCPNLQVTVVNDSSHTISGGIWGTTGNLGSSGYSINPGQTQNVGVFAQNYPQGDTFGLNGNIQWNGDMYEYQNCYSMVPGLNGCPDPSQKATMTISVQGSSDTATCAFSIVGSSPIAASTPTFTCAGGPACNGQTIIGTAYQQGCGPDLNTWVCTPSGWHNTGQACQCPTSKTFTCADGTACDGSHVTGTPYQQGCGFDFKLWTCMPDGWQPTGIACSCS